MKKVVLLYVLVVAFVIASSYSYRHRQEALLEKPLSNLALPSAAADFVRAGDPLPEGDPEDPPGMETKSVLKNEYGPNESLVLDDVVEAYGENMPASTTNADAGQAIGGDTVIASLETSPVLYDFTLRPGWSDWSWGVKSLLPQDGGEALVHFTEPWSGFSLHSDGLSTVGYYTLVLSLRGDVDSSADGLFIGLGGKGGTELGSVPLSDYIQNGMLPSKTASEVRIPLAYVGAYSSSVTSFTMQSSEERHVFIDLIALTSEGGTTRQPDLAAESAEESHGIKPFGDTLAQGDGSWAVDTFKPESDVLGAHPDGMFIRFLSSWAGLHVFEPGGTDPFRFAYLSFRLTALDEPVPDGRSRTEAAHTLYVDLFDMSGQWIGNVDARGSLSGQEIIPGKTHEIYIPLAKGNPSYLPISKFVIQSKEPGRFIFENIHFTN